MNLKLRKIGNSVGLILPKEALNKLKADAGDTVKFSESTDGYQLSAIDPEFDKTMAVFESLARRYRNTLAELAK